MTARAAPSMDSTDVPPRRPLLARVGQKLLRRADNRRPGPLEPIAADIARRLSRRDETRRVLQGNWLGHAAHPMLTDFTEGPWMAASFLDLFGPAGSEPAARRLVGLGLLASLPTMMSGLVDWNETRSGTRRVGLLHATTSFMATVLYGASYVARRRRRQPLAVALGVLGGLTAFADGYVGGELSLVARTGTGRRD